MYVEEPWKGSVPEVNHKRTTDGSNLRVIDPNGEGGSWFGYHLWQRNIAFEFISCIKIDNSVI